MKHLVRYTVNPQIFETILVKYNKHVVQVDQIEKYYYGYSEKDLIFYDGNGTLIITISALRPVLHEFLDERDWLQVIIEYNEVQKSKIEKDISGLIAYQRLESFLNLWYNNGEIKQILSKDWMQDSALYPQIHYFYDSGGKIAKFENCYKYDINGAHAFILSKMFPKATAGITERYLNRKHNPETKKVFNYSVGWIKHMGYNNAYNYIRTSVSKIMEDTINKVGGKIIYINTDGFIVSNPENPLTCSNMLGDFKEEYHGPVYVYNGENYWIYQTTEEIKGSAMVSVRHLIDLPNGKVVKYKRSIDKNGLVFADNLEEVQL